MTISKRLTLVVASLLLGAWTSGTDVKPAQLADFKAGVTTTAEVTAKLGKPQKTGKAANGDATATYYHMNGVPNAATYVPLVRLLANSSKVHWTMEVFEFDPTGHMVSEVSSEGDMVCRYSACDPTNPPPQPAPTAAATGH